MVNMVNKGIYFVTFTRFSGKTFTPIIFNIFKIEINEFF